LERTSRFSQYKSERTRESFSVERETLLDLVGRGEGEKGTAFLEYRVAVILQAMQASAVRDVSAAGATGVYLKF